MGVLRVEPISPKVLLVKSNEPPMAVSPLPPNPGWLKFGVLVKLKNCARNWRRVLSLVLKSLNTEKSKL